MPCSPFYKYETLSKLYKENINPVIIHLLTSDKETKPPSMANRKRQTGRPRSSRLRKKSKLSYETEPTQPDNVDNVPDNTKTNKPKKPKKRNEESFL
jgi:hypothetical protein